MRKLNVILITCLTLLIIVSFTSVASISLTREVVVSDNGASVKVRGTLISRDDISISYRADIISLESTRSFDSAEITLPFNQPYGVYVEPEVLTRSDTRSEWKEMEVDKIISGNTLRFNTTHFSDYTIGIGQDFGNCLTACLNFINGTSDRCVIATSGNYSISDCSANYSIRVQGITNTDDAMIESARPNDRFGGGGHDNYIGTAIARTLVRLNTISSVFNNTMTTAQYCMYLKTESLGTAKQTRGYRIINNSWVELQVTWNETVYQTTDWNGTDGANTSGTDYIAWSSGDPELNFTANPTLNSFHCWNIPTDWIQEWYNGSLPNEGFILRYVQADEGGAGTLRFYSSDTGSDSQEPYFEINGTGYNATAYSQYDFTGSAIRITGDNVNLDCRGVPLIGDDNGADTGIDFYRGGGNSTITNCTIQDFGSYCFKVDGLNTNMTMRNNIAHHCQENSWTGGNIDNYNFRSNMTYKREVILTRNMLGWTWENITFGNMDCTTSACFIWDGGDYVDINRLIITTNSTTVPLIEIDDESDHSAIRNCYLQGFPDEEGIRMISGNNLYNRIHNCTIINTLIGIELYQGYTNLTNNTIINTSLEGILLGNSANDNYVGYNILNGTGNSSVINQYLLNLDLRNYSGSTYNYSATTYIYDSTGFGGIVADSTDVSQYFNGSNNVTTCLMDVCGLGTILTTFLTDDQTCNDIDLWLRGAFCGGLPSTIDYQEVAYITQGVGGDYNVSYNASTTKAHNGLSDPQLIYNVLTSQDSAPIHIKGDGNYVYANTILNSSVDLFNSIVIESGGDNNLFWLNSLLFAGISDSGTGNTYCYGVLGNFYWGNLTVQTGDCGQADIITYNIINDTVLYLRWNPQDSLYNITYVIRAYGQFMNFTAYSNDTWVYISGVPEDEYNITVRPREIIHNRFATMTYYQGENQSNLVVIWLIVLAVCSGVILFSKDRGYALVFSGILFLTGLTGVLVFDHLITYLVMTATLLTLFIEITDFLTGESKPRKIKSFLNSN